MRCATLAAALATSAVPVAAAEIVSGLGLDDLARVADAGPAAVLLELRADTVKIAEDAALGMAVAAEADAGGDAWAGVGPFVAVETGLAGLRIEASFMPGYYHEADDDLGLHVIFRSQIGLSVPLSAGWRVGAALDHKSNGGLAEYNPGIETLFLTLSHDL